MQIEKEYWALSEDIGSKIKEKVDMYQNFLRTSRLINIWRMAYNQYYRASTHGGDIMALGENGEYSGVYVNHYRSLVVSKLNLIVGQRPSFQCRASNSDYKSQVQAKLGNGILDYYVREKRIDGNFNIAAEQSLAIFGESFISSTWDTDIGDDYGVNETGSTIKNGDIVYRNHTPNLVARDPTLKSNADSEWMIITTFENKFNLANKYPEKYDKIISLSYDYRNELYDLNLRQFGYNTNMETNIIPVYTLYHKQTKSIQDGRLVICLDDDIVLVDSPMPYDGIPVSRISTGDIYNSIFAYTEFWDLLPVQKALDNSFSTIDTNQSAFGVQNISMPRNANIEVSELNGSLNSIEYDGNIEPKVLNLLSTPVELFNHINKLEVTMEKLSAISSTRRGQLDTNIKSGRAIALLTGQALENSLVVQASFIKLMEDTGTNTIKILKNFAKVPRIAMIAGSNNREYIKEFTGDDVSSISRVIVDIGNPLANTTAGRLELATNYMEIAPEFRDKWMSIVNTGRIESFMEGDTNELLLIQSENESMQDGNVVQALILDNHDLHITHHKKELFSPEARANPELVQMVLAHIQEHINLKLTGDPNILAFTNSGNANIQKPMPIQQDMPVNDSQQIQ